MRSSPPSILQCRLLLQCEPAGASTDYYQSSRARLRRWNVSRARNAFVVPIVDHFIRTASYHKCAYSRASNSRPALFEQLQLPATLKLTANSVARSTGTAISDVRLGKEKRRRARPQLDSLPSKQPRRDLASWTQQSLCQVTLTLKTHA